MEDRLVTCLRDLQKKLGLTQFELAIRIGIRPETLTQWYMGHNKPSHMSKKIIRIFIKEKLTINKTLTAED